MDEEEFAKYLLNLILPLFPHAKDKAGHQVLLKVDSGPGQMNLITDPDIFNFEH
jgi:hypothetical protein